MKIKKRELISKIIVVILFCAFFNDILRIPDTAISAYRLLIPCAAFMALVYIRYTWKFFLGGIALMVPLIIQNLIFCKVLKIESSIDFNWQLRYLIHYGCIFAIFVLMRILRKESIDQFSRLFFKLIPVVSILNILIYIISLTPYYSGSGLANLNNYAVCLAAIFPWHLLEAFGGKLKDAVICITILIILWKGDSKAALAGIAIEIGIIGIIQVVKKIKEGNKTILFFSIIVIAAGICICLSPLKINGYGIREMFTGMLSHIVRGEPYERNTSSLTFRTNSIIYMLKGMKDTYFIGMGIGNTGKYLRVVITDYVSNKALSAVTLSPHWAVLEFFCDCGIWAMVLCVYVYVIAIKKLFQAKNIKKLDAYFVAFTLSLPMWSMSASGLYTTYLVFVIIAWLYERHLLDKEDNFWG